MPPRKCKASDEEASAPSGEEESSDSEEDIMPVKKVARAEPGGGRGGGRGRGRASKLRPAEATGNLSPPPPPAPPAAPPPPPPPPPEPTAEQVAANEELEAPLPRAAEEESEDEQLDLEAYEARELSLREAEAERMKHILANFTPAQLDRYECFRRSVLPRGVVRKLAVTVIGAAPKDASLVVLSGLAKTFVGQLVEEGRRVMAERGDGAGALRPAHVQEAHRRLCARGKTYSNVRVPSVLAGQGAASRGRL